MTKEHIKFTLLSIFFACSCINSDVNTESEAKPNFIIFIADDISWDDIGYLGNKLIKTPNIDKLFSEGLVFKNMYLTTSSCSPSRNSIITGRYPHNTGAPELHTEPPMGMKTFVKGLKRNNYYTVSSGKFHMGDYARDGFDLIHEKIEVIGNGGEKKWVETLENRPKNRPFFFWFASLDAHRSWGKNQFSKTHNPQKINPPEYLIDDYATKKDLANYYDEITRLDYYIGKVIKTLKKQSIYKNTVIMIMSDNGRPFPHSKTLLNDQGVKTPFVFVYKNENVMGETEALVSSIDIAPTILELAGLKIGENYQGKSFKKLLLNPTEPFRNFVFAEHNWHDFEAHERMVRSKDFMYIENRRNKFPQKGPLDVINSDSYLSLLDAYEKGVLTKNQEEIFISPRFKEELYEMKTDLYQRHNLINSKKYKNNIELLKSVLNQWKIETGDSEPREITKDWYERRPGPKAGKSLKNTNLIGPNSLVTEFHGKRGELPGASNNAIRINNNGPF